MPFEIPTLPALVQRAAEDLSRAGVDGVLRRSDVAVLSRVLAGGALGLYGMQGWLADQVLPDKCDEVMLARWAALKKVRRNAAVAAVGSVDVTGTDNVQVPANFVWQTRSGARLIATESTVIASGAATVPVVAADPGQSSNLPAGVQVSAVSPLSGLSDDALVSAGGLVGGTDQESIERWRRRVCRAFSMKPHGGALADYETWALEVPGITRAWARGGWVGPGTIGLFVVRDDDAVISPDEPELDAVRDYIAAPGRRPATAEVHVLAPSLLTVDVQIELVPDDSVVRARVAAALADLFLSEADLGARLYRTHIAQAISNTPGELDHTLVAPAADIVSAANELAVLGAITWL